jgi:phosphonate transport system substrate-binding protein
MNIKSIKKVYFFFSLIFLVVTFFNCKKNDDVKKVRVDFSHREEIQPHESGTGPPLRAAVSAMISPKESFIYYSKIFDYISAQIGRSIVFKQRKTYQEVNDLLRFRELDFAYICSGAYIEAKENFGVEILVIPQVKGKTVYHAYIIARSDSGIEKLGDFKGRPFAFTDPMSNTGCLYPQYLLKNLNHSAEAFFENIIYTNAHDYSIQAVETGLVHGASVDSLVYDYIRENHSHDITSLKIIKKSKAFGIPPIVVHPGIDLQLKRDLQSAFLNMSDNLEGMEILSHLSIDSFVQGNDDDYDSIREMRALIQK